MHHNTHQCARNLEINAANIANTATGSAIRFVRDWRKGDAGLFAIRISATDIEHILTILRIESNIDYTEAVLCVLSILCSRVDGIIAACGISLRIAHVVGHAGALHAILNHHLGPGGRNEIGHWRDNGAGTQPLRRPCLLLCIEHFIDDRVQTALLWCQRQGLLAWSLRHCEPIIN